MENGLLIGIAAFCVFILVVFLVFAFLFPELVGIQGKLARQVEDSHRSESSTNDLEHPPQKNRG